MGIADEDVARVRAATDIVALIGEQTALKKQGRRWVGLCPFHGEKSPSFSVNAEEGLYHCFGCQVSGDAISFVRATEHLDFVDAVRRLADRVGLTIREDEAATREGARRKPLMEAMERAVAWYHERLLTSPDAGPARDYLRSRGYGGDVVRRFRLGWAPDDWDALARALDLSPEVLEGTGLGFVNKRDRRQDAFRARVLFPICDPSGRPVALGGRILPGAVSGGNGASPGPKYKNSPETPIYSKRRTLYALNWAKQDVVASGEVIVCEGYTDVIGFFEAGLPRAVATCGTALAEEHFHLLRNFGKRIVLAYDADGAGQKATGRVYEWERRHEVDVVVAALPAGSDPADLARTDPDALRAAVAGAQPYLRFRVERALDVADVSSPEGRAKAADRALGAVAEHPDDLVRDQYVMLVADRCRLEPDMLRDRLGRIRRGEVHVPAEPGERGRRAPSEGRSGSAEGWAGTAVGRVGTSARRTDPGDDASAPPWDGDDGEPLVDRGSGTAGPGERPAGRAGRRAEGDLGSRPGLEALRLAIHRPEEMASRLEEELFADGVQREAFRALLHFTTLHEAIDSSPPEVSALLTRLAVEEPATAADDVMVQLVRAAARRMLADLEREVRLAPGSAAEAATTAAHVRLLLEDLGDPVSGGAAADRLLAWLVGRRLVSE